MRLRLPTAARVLAALYLMASGAGGCMPAADEGSSTGGTGGGSGGAGGRGGAAGGGGSRAGTGGAGGTTAGAGGAGGNGNAGSSGSGGSAGGSGGASAGAGGSGVADAGGGGAAGTGGQSGTGGQPDAAGGGSEASTPDGNPGVPPGEKKVVLLMGDPNVNDPSRSQMIEILNSMKASHGVVLEVMNSQNARAANMMDKALIIAGPNNNYCIDTPEPAFRTLPVPIIVSRDCKTTAFGLATMMNTQEYVTGLPVKVVIENTEHPLAAGLPKGTIPVLQTRCRLVRGRDLGPDAIKIARPPDDATPAAADSWAIFAYEKGGTMAGGLKAPAKRMGFFWHRPSAVTPEGRKLFVAAVEWALRP
jgi:hypothetical protein